MSGVVGDGSPTGAACGRCGHRLDHLVREIEGALLERCPVCTAYDWQPAPIFEKHSAKESA